MNCLNKCGENQIWSYLTINLGMEFVCLIVYISAVFSFSVLTYPRETFVKDTLRVRKCNYGFFFSILILFYEKTAQNLSVTMEVGALFTHIVKAVARDTRILRAVCVHGLQFAAQFKKRGFYTRNFKLSISWNSSVYFPNCLELLPLLHSGALEQVRYMLLTLTGSRL